MRFSVRLVLPTLVLSLATSTGYSSDPGLITSAGGGTGDMSTLQTYLQNLGIYLGYNITGNPPTNPDSTPPVPYQNLLDPSAKDANAPATLLNATYNAVTAYLAASYLTPTMSGSGGSGSGSYVGLILSSAVQGTNNSTTVINNFKNLSFNPSSYGNTYGTPSNTTISVSPMIDQQPYQADPVSQGILNILATPDYTNCQGAPNQNGIPTCVNPINNSPVDMSSLTQYQVMSNVLGAPQSAGSGADISNTPLPGPYDYLSGDKNAQILAQLNVNSLLGPMIYSSPDANDVPLPNTIPNSAGLVAANGSQLAANFIRYVSGIVSPMSLPDVTTYNQLLGTANGKFSPTQQQAKATLVMYLTNVRTYAAQMSVGLSNLYYIMSKRIPIQNNPLSASGSNNSPSSEALNEFNMATWRLFNPANTDSKSPTQWINQINNASPATVQKEMAVLLAEINYQLYLNRQQEERLLLTNTLLLLQNAKAGQPSPQLNAPSTTPATQ